MFNWIRFSRLFLSWRARRAGTLDGRTLIPHRDDDRPPKYLLFLRDIGHWRAGGLEWRWQLQDQVLYPAYVRAVRLCEQARERLEEASQQYGQAEEARRERGTDRNIKALKRAAGRRAAALRRFGKAEIRLAAARANRQSRWEEARARFRTLAAEMDQYMQVYSDFNVKARDENDCPPGLLEENRPRLALPGPLGSLDWAVPARTAPVASLPHSQNPSLPG